MTIANPMPIEDLADRLLVSSVSWSLAVNQQLSGLGSGQILVADLAPALWSGDAETVEMYHREARRIEARINALDGALGSFHLYDPRFIGPYADPDGAMLGESVVQIAALPDAKSISLKGLPAGYELTEGDYLAFDYGDPVKRAFHELSEAVTADSSGIAPAAQVRPAIRPGASVDTIVTLVRPAMKCLIKPGSLTVHGTGKGTTVIGFSVMQRP